MLPNCLQTTEGIDLNQASSPHIRGGALGRQNDRDENNDPDGRMLALVQTQVALYDLVLKGLFSASSMQSDMEGGAVILVKHQVVEDAFRHGLAAGDRVKLNRPVGDTGRPLLP
jgi:hypothetical protein